MGGAITGVKDSRQQPGVALKVLQEADHELLGEGEPHPGATLPHVGLGIPQGVQLHLDLIRNEWIDEDPKRLHQNSRRSKLNI